MSTPKDRLFEVYLAYQSALSRRAADLAEATSQAQVTQILTSIDKLQSQYFKAALSELSATSGEVDLGSNDREFWTYRRCRRPHRHPLPAKSLAERISLVAKVVAKVGELVKKAAA